MVRHVGIKHAEKWAGVIMVQVAMGTAKKTMPVTVRVRVATGNTMPSCSGRDLNAKALQMLTTSGTCCAKDRRNPWP